VEPLTRVLAMVDPAESATAVLARAIPLVRHLGASLDVLLCERSPATRSGADFLKGLTAALASTDLRLTQAVRSGPSSAEIVSAFLRERPSDLVVKFPGRQDPDLKRTWSSNDWQLVQLCGRPLLLTRGKPWRPQPQFAVAADVSTPDAGNAQAVLRDAVILAMRLGADGERVRVVAAGSSGTDFATSLSGETTDMVALSAHTERRDWRERLRALTSELIDRCGCDLLLIPELVPQLSRQ